MVTASTAGSDVIGVMLPPAAPRGLAACAHAAGRAAQGLEAEMASWCACAGAAGDDEQDAARKQQRAQRFKETLGQSGSAAPAVRHPPQPRPIRERTPDRQDDSMGELFALHLLCSALHLPIADQPFCFPMFICQESS